MAKRRPLSRKEFFQLVEMIREDADNIRSGKYTFRDLLKKYASVQEGRKRLAHKTLDEALDLLEIELPNRLRRGGGPVTAAYDRLDKVRSVLYLLTSELSLPPQTEEQINTLLDWD